MTEYEPLTEDEIAEAYEDIGRNKERFSTRDVGEMILGLMRRLDPANRDRVREYLFRVVDEESHDWGNALEALVLEAETQTPERLERMLDPGGAGHVRSRDSEEEIVFDLIALGYAKGADRIKAYVNAALREDRNGCVVLVAAVSKLDPDWSVEMLANYYTSHLARGRPTPLVASYTTPIVSHFIKKDPALLERLVQRVASNSRKAAAALAQLIDEELTKPWNLRRYGGETVQQARESLKQALG